jgi:hypothetical protein
VENAPCLGIPLRFYQIPRRFWQEKHANSQDQCWYNLDSEGESPLELACSWRVEGSIADPSVFFELALLFVLVFFNGMAIIRADNESNTDHLLC